MNTWRKALGLIRAEASPAVARRIEAKLRAELAGERISVPAPPQPRVADEEIRRTLRKERWNVTRTAQALGISQTAVFRRLEPKRTGPIIRFEIDNYLGGRLVR